MLRQGGAKCPHLPFGLCPRIWDSAHVPEHELDDAAIYGSGLGRREHWPSWLLVRSAGCHTSRTTAQHADSYTN